MSRLAPLLAFIALVALLAFGIHWNRSHETNEVPSPLIDKPAPAFKLPLLLDADKSLDSKALLGEPYLINVFGSWCGTCQEEHPLLMREAKRFGVKLIGLNWKDQGNDARNWLAQFGNPYDVIVADADGRTGIEFGVYGAPETFLVDAQGVVRYKRIGLLTPDSILTELKPALAKLGVTAK